MAGDLLRVLVVDDHPLFRCGVCTLLANEPVIDVGGETATGMSAVNAAAALLPDVVVMDLHLPDISGVQATRKIVAIFGPDIATRVLGFFNNAQPSTDPIFPELTGREREVLALIAAGHNNTVIAQTLSLSPKTVRNHISSVFSKLQVADRAAAIIRARDAGLGRLGNGSIRRIHNGFSGARARPATGPRRHHWVSAPSGRD